MRGLRWLVLPVLMLLTACGTGDSGPAKPQVALIMKSLANEFFSTMAAGAERHHTENAQRYDLIVNGIKDERDLGCQVALVDEMIARGVDAIVIAPADSKALVTALRRASESGIVVINIDNKLDAQVLEDEALSIPFVGPDNRAGARKVGDHLAQLLEPGAQVLVLEGTRTSFNAQQRRLGFADAMRDAGMVIADSQSANWEMASANTFTTSMLAEYPQASAVLAANDSMALGALAAVRATGREIKIVGFDNITAVQQAIREGRILATADQHADQLATFGIDYALRLLADPDQTLNDLETPVDLITASTLD
jgi:ribose transport system substrate-binding protein